MKTTILFLTTCLIHHLVVAQEFSFQLYFEDAIGNKDTLTLGFDPNATNGIDELFGEVNVLEQPLDSSFDVRVSDYYDGSLTFQTKRQIAQQSCFGSPQNAEIHIISIKCSNWPIAITWDNALFQNNCVNGSFMTGVHPGGWWDVDTPSGLWQMFFNQSNASGFLANCHEDNPWDDGVTCYQNEDGDWMSNYFLMFGPYFEIGVNEENVLIPILSVYPNPVHSTLSLELSSGINLVEVYSVFGRKQKEVARTKQIDVSDLVAGIYFLVVTDFNGNRLWRRFEKI